MVPNFPGGRQSIGAANPLGQMPSGVLGSGNPTSFPHQVTRPGGTPIYPGASPGQRVSPASRTLSKDIETNYGTFPSNELVSQPLVLKNWNSSVAYEKKQQPGDILFMRRAQDSHVSSGATLNLAQMNEHLQEGYRHLQTQGTAAATSAFIYEGATVAQMDVPVLEALEQYRTYGEMALVEDPALKKKIADDRSMKALIFVSKEHIVNAYNFIGIYMNDEGTDVEKPNRSIIVGVAGPTHYQEVTNVWGEIADSQALYLVLTRRKLDGGGYGAFVWLPYVGYDAYPPPHFGVYYDEAGIRHEPHVVYVGRAYYRPEKWNEPTMCRQLAGITASSSDAAELATRARRVAINLGIPRHRLELFPCA